MLLSGPEPSLFDIDSPTVERNCGGGLDPIGLVEATERLYRSLFTAAILLALCTAVWGMAIAPFNGFNSHHPLSVGFGAALAAIALLGVARRQQLYNLLRRRPAWLLGVVVLLIAVLWLDGTWRSSYYLASYSAIGLAAVVADLRWTLLCGLILAAGYLTGLAIEGYSWAELRVLNEADSVVANTGGYLIAACFLAMPISWLGGYVARIHQVVSRDTKHGDNGLSVDPLALDGDRITDRLSVREVEVVQLLAGGATNEQIAQCLVVSARTVHSHVENALKKTGAKNRTDLAVIAVQDGLVPDRAAISAPEPALPGKISISTD